MSRFHSYINTAVSILSVYTGNEPFATFIKKYFAANRKHGSGDRKIISHLCYCYFRAARIFEEDRPDEKIVKSLYLCSTEQHPALADLKPVWNEKVQLTTAEKLHILDINKPVSVLFPFSDQLSRNIDTEAFALSLLKQPDLYIRVRPGLMQNVLYKLNDASIPFSARSANCIAIPNSTKIEEVIELNREAVIQDYNSQRVGEMMELVKKQVSATKLNVWDCCAASGGKSIMAKDILGDIRLMVSDKRATSIANLKKRFSEAGITGYTSLVIDLEDLKSLQQSLHQKKFSLIIADVPCTGSGTWSRTPEQFFWFDRNKLNVYASLQKKIISNVITYLQPGGHLLYITCSVFEKENEGVVDFMQNNLHLSPVKTELFRGYDKKADTLFASLLTKL